jgi:hypothetical protein
MPDYTETNAASFWTVAWQGIPWGLVTGLVMGLGGPEPGWGQQAPRPVDRPICVLPEAPFQGKKIRPAPEKSARPKTATITVNYRSGGSIYGYSCSAWPQDAKDAFGRAVSTWEGLIDAGHPIAMDACWSTALPSGTLGSAGPVTLHHSSSFTGAPKSGTWYPVALANSMEGADLNGSSDAEIQAVFNANKSDWYFGADPGAVSAGEHDFETVVLHEIGHGLGFTGSAKVDDGTGDDECRGTADEGCLGIGSPEGPAAYDHFVEEDAAVSLLNYTDPSADLGTVLTGGTTSGGGGGLFFNGSAVVAANGGGAALYAPSTWTAGSSFSHWDQTAFPDELMKPQLPRGQALRDPQLALSLLQDLGWNQTIPVEWVAFDAVTAQGDVMLTWQTASETANAGFRIEHRPRGDGAFAVLDFVDGAGTTTEPQSYRYRVKGLPPGSYDFRLKQIDTDGTAWYSPTVEATVALEAPYRLSPVYPNPMRTAARLKLRVREAQPVYAAAYNALGRRVQTLHAGPVAAHAAVEMTLRAEQLPSGVYFVRVEGETFSAARRVTLVR